MASGRAVGWAVAAGAFLSATSWGLYERSTRARSEEDREKAHGDLTQTIKTLEETEKRRNAFEVELGKVRADQEDLSRRFVETQLRNRANEDTLLTEKGSLQSQVERLEKTLKGSENDLQTEKDSFAREQSRRAQTEAQLAAERDAGKETANQWRLERAAAEAQARKQATELQRANENIRTIQGDLANTQALLQRSQDTVRQLQGDLGKTLNERDIAAVTSQQTGAALNQTVEDLRRRETDVIALQGAAAQLNRALNSEQRESQQLQRANQNLASQVQQLTAQNRQLSVQNQQLAAQIQQLQAQIKALNDQLAALRGQNR